MILVYIIIGLFVITILLASYIATSIFKPKKYDYEQTRTIETEKKFLDEAFIKDFTVEDVYITSEGLKLHAHFINNNSDKTIIIMHGHTYTLFGSYKYANIFLRSNYNILMPDQRYHGLSEGKNCTLGYRESADLNEWIQFIKQTRPTNNILGLHGESMGAATVLLGGNNQAVDFIISDCSFSSFKTEVEEIISNQFKIPKFFVYPIHLASLILYKAPLIKINPINNLKHITAPILFIHGDKDSFIDVSHLRNLTTTLKETDMVYVCKGADHAQSYETNPKEYNRTIKTFLQHNHIEDGTLF